MGEGGLLGLWTSQPSSTKAETFCLSFLSRLNFFLQVSIVVFTYCFVFFVFLPCLEPLLEEGGG